MPRNVSELKSGGGGQFLCCPPTLKSGGGDASPPPRPPPIDARGSSSQTLFSISCIMSTPLSPRCLIRSIGRPEQPGAFPFLILSMAFFTSSLDISWTGPSTAGTSPSCSLTFSRFRRLLKYSLHLSLIFTSSVSISPVWSLITFTSSSQLG